MIPAERTFTRGLSLGRRRSRGTDGASIVFIHGLGESGLCFEGLYNISQLSPWQLLVPDIPGYGRSPWPSSPLSLPTQADLLAEWMSYEISGPVFLAGHSMGGVVAQFLAERHPGLVKAIVNIDGNISPGDCVFSGRAARQPLEDFLDGGFDKLRQAIRIQGRNNEALHGYEVSLRLCDPAVFHLNSLDLVRESGREDLAKRLVALDIPHLYLAGRPKGACARSQELLDAAGANWQAIEPSGHWPFIDHPEAFSEALSDFLGGF